MGICGNVRLVWWWRRLRLRERVERGSRAENKKKKKKKQP